MHPQSSGLQIIRLAAESSPTAAYDNHAIARVNNHVVRISTMTEPYAWHCHPDSDEAFLVLEGGLFIDLDDRTIELPPGHMITIDRGIRHRTRPIGARSVNLSFESATTRTKLLDPPSTASS